MSGAAFIAGAYTAAGFGAALLIGAALRGKRSKSPCLVQVTDRYAIDQNEPNQCVSGVVRFDPNRYRRRPMPTSGTDQFTLPLERRYPELARRLQETALRLARERGTITSDDVWDAHPIPAGIEPRIMAAAFKPRTLWRKTGVYVPTRRPSANRRPIPCWQLRDAA